MYTKIVQFPDSEGGAWLRVHKRLDATVGCKKPVTVSFSRIHGVLGDRLSTAEAWRVEETAVRTWAWQVVEPTRIAPPAAS